MLLNRSTAEPGQWLGQNRPKMRTPKPIFVIFTLVGFAITLVLALWAADEMHYSHWQARHFTASAQQMTFQLADGAQPETPYPTSGPYFQRLGYAFLPYFIKALESAGFKVNQQAKTSEAYQEHVNAGGFPIYPVKGVAGLEIFDREQQRIYQNQYPTRAFDSFRAIPPVLVQTLLFIENRELIGDWPSTRNPVVEWSRFFLAGFGHIFGEIIGADDFGGGSTLATQLEKFRFSPGGQTINSTEKFRQLIAASLRVYQQGPDTRSAREQIVLDYLNATPLAARGGWGEINGIGDGLRAWFGMELTDISRLLQLSEDNPTSLREKAKAYRHVLALILAQRRPAFYLMNNRAALEELVNITLANLRNGGVISPRLYEATHATRLLFAPRPPQSTPLPYVMQKAVNAIRTRLLGQLNLQHLYELDRFDLAVSSTLDMRVQNAATEFMQQLKDPAFVTSIGLRGDRLLGEDADPTKINWTLLLYERTPNGNLLRAQTDNLDRPLDLNDGAKLDLGSTAKLRTMVTYLEIIAEIYERYTGLDVPSLELLRDGASDNLTRWVAETLLAAPNLSLTEILAAAMERRYSANAAEGFFTGSGVLTFNNFDKADNSRIVSVTEAFRHSVNLPFIRMMRDIVAYTIAQGPNPKREILGDPTHPERQAYLERFADNEGRVFMSRFFSAYRALDAEGAFQRLASRGRESLAAQATIFRLIKPHHNFTEFKKFLSNRLPERTARLDDEDYKKLFLTYGRGKFSLADQGYIAGVHPLEIWLTAYRQTSGEWNLSTVMQASRAARLASYAWLFNTRHKSAQDSRIRILLEQDAFTTIHARWQRLGYPFERLVPSLATSIGSSADRPGALADLMGIILNDGVRQPMLRYDRLNFAEGTPFQTTLTPDPAKAEQVLLPEIAATIRVALADVVSNGTAKRVSGVYRDAAGAPLAIGGKTGTGDHRYEEFGRGGQLLSSRVVNRTATLVFYVGDRFFGVVTAYVAGEEAANYKFTSALPSQFLKALAPSLQPFFVPGTSANPPAPTTTATPMPAPERATEPTNEATEPTSEPPPEAPTSEQAVPSYVF